MKIITTVSRKYLLLKSILLARSILLVLIISSVLIAQNKNAPGKVQVYGVAFLRSMYNDVNYNDAKAALKVYIDELQKKLLNGYKMKPVMYDNVEDLLKNYSKENLADITLTPLDFLKYKSRLSLYPVLVASGYNSPFENYLILIRKDSDIKNIKDLADKKFGMIQTGENSVPLMWLNVELNNKHSYKKNFFKRVILGKSESKLILSLFFNQIDACLVSKTSFETMIELNPQIKNQTRILCTSPGYLTEVSSFTKKFNESKFSTDLFNTLLKLDDYSAGKQLFALSKTAKIIPYKEEYMYNIKKLIHDYSKIKN